MTKSKKEIKINPIGYVKSEPGSYKLQISKEFLPALKQLEHFSHIHVIWWAHQNDTPKARKMLTTTPPYGENLPETGVFATRAEYRPNPIAMTISQITNIDYETGEVSLTYIDAFDETPIIDIKAYFPICDRIRDAHIAPWLKQWPDWYEDGAEWWAAQDFE